MDPKPVIVTVSTAISQDGNKDELVTGGNGFFYKKGNEAYLQYEELSPEGSIRSILKMESGKALLLRSGAVKMRMPFRLGEETRGSYETQYGTLPVSAVTDRLAQAIRENGRGGVFRLKYDLMIAGAPAGTYSLAIMFEEEEV
ncbi:hypothetical protein A8F94_20855 [Bacillus sp. FJAT-27225]|uniref:DUF1934 domain-containing protein n=1 Tax=Bacillus sp. FJAT-27225 TaxID=1743144 RepID=UPI00080C3191|nr:DUF1934 domain-containing protein [Bacillus sp. FJAT-27225]OCA82356.1 hypothetical protein A8F94_20855 [Bacillus sp. FJAT-27225]